jgi:hypothetical protein
MLARKRRTLSLTPRQDICKAALFENSKEIVAGELVFGEGRAAQTTKKSRSLTGVA